MRKTFLPCLVRVLVSLPKAFSTALVPGIEELHESNEKQESFC